MPVLQSSTLLQEDKLTWACACAFDSYLGWNYAFFGTENSINVQIQSGTLLWEDKLTWACAAQNQRGELWCGFLTNVQSTGSSG